MVARGSALRGEHAKPTNGSFATSRNGKAIGINTDSTKGP
jgi:hypothetical protein